MIKVKIDVLEAMKEAGYSSYRIQKEMIFGGRATQKIRDGGVPSWGEMDKICRITGLKIEDIVEWVEDEEPVEEGDR